MISWIFFKLFFTLKNSVVNGVGWVWKFRNADWAVTNQKKILRKFYWKWFYKKNQFDWDISIWEGNRGHLQFTEGEIWEILENVWKKRIKNCLLAIPDGISLESQVENLKLAKILRPKNFSSLNLHFTCWYLIFSSSIHLP